jgi:MerR family transcriptional regulator, copper efflux regulator
VTAYGALTRAARVRPGDTVFVSGGAGSVGSMAGQVARLLGAGRVIGSTGSAWKARQMTAGLGYDAAVVRGAAPVAGQLPKAAPDGEANGLLPPPRRTRAGQRVYGPREVARLRAIRELLLLGLTVADIRNCADRLDLLEGDTLPPYGGPGACASPTGIAARRIAALDDEIARLTALRDQLAARIGAEPARTS